MTYKNTHTPTRKLLLTTCVCVWAFFAQTVTAINATTTNNTKTEIRKKKTTRHDTVKQQNGNSAENNTGKDLAAEIMQKVFAYPTCTDIDSLQYVSDVYLRHVMHTKRKGPIVRYIPGMLRLERGHNDYLTEAHLRIQHRPPGQNDCKIIAYHSTAKYQTAQRLESMSRFNLSIYESKLFTDAILNPLNRRNRRFYKYSYAFTSKLNDSVPPTVRIHIKQRFTNDRLVKGFIDVDLNSGAVKNFTFHFHYKMRNITINARMGNEGYESFLPTKMRIVSEFRLLGNKVNEVIEVASQHSFSRHTSCNEDKKKKYDLTQLCLLRIDTARIINNAGYFENYRKSPLRESEQLILTKFNDKKLTQNVPQSSPDNTTPSDSLDTILTDSVEFFQNDSTRNNDIPDGWFGERTQNVLLSSHYINIGGFSKIKLPPIITPSMIGWSHTKGISLKTRVQWNLYGKQSQIVPLLEFAPSIGYSFKQKQVYWTAPLQIRFSPRYNGTFTLNAGGGAHMYNSRQADDLRKSLEGVEIYDSLVNIINHYGFHDYRDTHVNMDLGFSIFPGLRFTIGSRYHCHSLIEWNELAEKANMKKHFSSVGPRVLLEWTPAQYYYREGKRRIPLYSPAPTFLFCYERGYALGQGNTQYERFEGDIRYRLPLYAMRTLYFRAGGGAYTQRGKDCFLDYDYFNFSYMPSSRNDDMSSEFQLLSSRWYNESRYYLQFTGTYESPMLLFSRLPMLSKVVQKERVYLNLLTVKTLGFYGEMGYGINTNIIDLGAFIGIAPDRSIDFGLKFILNFFED